MASDIEHPAGECLRVKPLAAQLSSRLFLLTCIQIGLLPAVLAVRVVFVLPRYGWPLNWATVMNWCLEGIEWVPFMMLAFWCGWGTSSGTKRFFGGLIGAAYLAGVWVFFQRTVLPWSLGSIARGIAYERTILGEFVWQWLFFVPLAIAVLPIRQYLAQLRWMPDITSQRFNAFQFTIRHWLLLVAILALALTIARSDHAPWSDPPWFWLGPGWMWREWGRGAFQLLLLLINILCATTAIMQTGHLARRFVFALALSGVAVLAYRYITTYSFEHDRYLGSILAGLLKGTLPMVLMSASLLVVRSCGYRLVPRA
jgi:hypothetical protein